MDSHRHFLLLGEADNFRIQVGDDIEILEAYERQGLPIALANRFCVNGTYQNFGISRPYIKKLTQSRPCRGEIVQLRREEKDLTITVEP